MDTWPLDYDYPVELNRYVYAAGNPATWSDPSGYSLTMYGMVQLQTLRNIESSVGEIYDNGMIGAVAGATGYIAGLTLGSLGKSINESFNGTQASDIETITERALDIMRSEYSLFSYALSAIGGFAQGAANTVFIHQFSTMTLRKSAGVLLLTDYDAAVLFTILFEAGLSSGAFNSGAQYLLGNVLENQELNLMSYWRNIALGGTAGVVGIFTDFMTTKTDYGTAIAISVSTAVTTSVAILSNL